MVGTSKEIKYSIGVIYLLTEADRDWVRSNRKEIMETRTEPVVIVHETVSETDPYTGEPTYTETQETVDALWKDFSSAWNPEKVLKAGVMVNEKDIRATFDIDVDLSDVNRVIRQGKEYAIISRNPRGIGGPNRVECFLKVIV